MKEVTLPGGSDGKDFLQVELQAFSEGRGNLTFAVWFFVDQIFAIRQSFQPASFGIPCKILGATAWILV